MDKKEKLERHIRLARKHIKEIEKLGYVVEVGHNSLNVYDYSAAPNEWDREFDPSDYTVGLIT